MLTLSVSGTTLSHRAVWLDCHGLDTVAEIRLNSKLVRSTTIMFHRYTFDVKDVLKVYVYFHEIGKNIFKINKYLRFVI